MIRVLVVDDSVTQREIFKRLLNGDPEMVVVGEAKDGRDALAKVRELSPDVVLMDIHMPDMDGITATREIMRHCPVPIVIASATLKKHEVDLAMQAYEAGAVSVIEKPEGAVLLHLHKIGPELRGELVAASRVRLARAVPVAESPRPGLPPPARPPADVRAIGICASTGGPAVLMQIFSGLPRPFPIPLLLVQHITRGFEEGFARWLSNASGQPVGLASNGQRLGAGIWMGPCGSHLTLAGPTRLELVPASPGDIHCPSGDPLFVSLGEKWGPKAVGVLLTGMGEDGASGLLALKRAGGMTLVQDEASSLIWGMPKAARNAGAATHELNPTGIVQALTRLAHPG